ncbi:MAG: 8-oxo-dGTP diphosphatase [Candidatus Woesearchaeota archaeon]|nr:8-oxo-dGTP diphosphatase [Candidatus Woesearchaeota archaeon]
MRPVTLVYCLKGNSVLLGMKKRGFGAEKLNGYGGKVQDGETIEEAAVRELYEEAKIQAVPSDLEKVAIIDFYFDDVPKEKNLNQTVHVYFLKKWNGEPKETEEMRPEWYARNSLPMQKMWIDDQYWLSGVLAGKKLRASFTFGNQGASVINHNIIYSESL